MIRLLFFITAFCSISLVFSQTPNLVSNGDFAGGTTGWTLLISDGSENGSVGAVTAGEYKTTIATVGAQAWYLQLTHSAISLIQGNDYIISFDAYAAANRTMVVNLGSGPNAYTSYSGETTFNITKTKTNYKTTFTMSAASNTNARLEFNVALSTSTIYIDNVSITIAPKDTSTPVGGRYFPFPNNAIYPNGIKPTNYTQNEMNLHCQFWYEKILAKYVTDQGCSGTGQYRYQRVETGDANTFDSVSESIGYGMLIMIYMDNATNNTKKYFDGMFNYYQSHLDGNGLMNWRIGSTGNTVGSGAATDADLDVAFALFMAHKQWGSNGTINYLQKAKSIASKILSFEITANNDVRPGDGWDIGNISYFTPAYFKIFAGITAETRWNSVAQKTYQTIVNSYYNSSSTYNTATKLYTGLMPNWCSYSGATESPGTWSMDYNSYWWDACRFPWRIGYDYLLHGTTNSTLAKTNTERISKFFKAKYSGNAALIKSHYTLSGDETIWSGTPNAFIGAEDGLNLAGITGSTAIAAMVDGDQAWLNTLYTQLVNMPMCETNINWGTDYFNDVLKMLYLLVLTGNQPDLYSTFDIVTDLHAKESTIKASNLQVSIFPNPYTSNSHISISAPENTSINAMLVDITGKQISSTHFENADTFTWQPDVTSLAPGIYLVLVNSDKEQSASKLIIR